MNKKFRIWSKEIKIFTNWAETSKDSFEEIVIHPSGALIAGKILLDSNQYIIQQWTGLLDKNGREIYEGDIVKIGDRIKEIEFKMGMFYIDEDYGDFVPASEVDNLIEVIGNIFETPLDNHPTKD